MASLSHRSGTFTRIAAAAAAVLSLPFAGVVTAHASPAARYRVRHALLSADGPTQVIDFGCGQGYFLDALRASGHHCLGIEISETTESESTD